MFSLDYQTSPPMTRKISEAILDLCLENCELFTMTLDNRYKNDIKANLDSFILCDINTTHWFSYYTTSSNPLHVLLYPVNEQTKEILKRYLKGFLEPITTSSFLLTQSLQDICFFREKKIFLGTVTHEEICCFYPSDSTIEALMFDKYPGWCKLTSGEYIALEEYFSI